MPAVSDLFQQTKIQAAQPEDGDAGDQRVQQNRGQRAHGAAREGEQRMTEDQ